MELVGDEAIKFAEENNLLSVCESMALPDHKCKEKAPYYWWIAMALHLVDRKPWFDWWGEYHPAYRKE